MTAATKHVRMPDGQIVEVPIDATQEDILEQLGRSNAYRSQAGQGTLRSFGDGALLGFRDNAEAALMALLPAKTSSGGRDDRSFMERYNEELGLIRASQDLFRQERPGLSTAATVAGGLTTGLATGGASKAIAGSKLLGGMAIGGAEGAIAGVGFSDGEDVASNVAIGTGLGIAGAAGGHYLNSLIRGIRDSARSATPVVQPALRNADDLINASRSNIDGLVPQRIAQAERIGMKVAPGFRAGRKGMSTQAGMVRDARVNQAFLDDLDFNQTRANEIVAEAIGLPPGTGNISEIQLGQAYSAASDLFEEALSGNEVAFTNASMQRMTKLMQAFDAEGLTPIPRKTINMIRKLGEQSVDGPVSAENVKMLNTHLNNVVRVAGKQGQSDLSDFARAMQNELMDATERGAVSQTQNSAMTMAELEMLREGKRRWRALMLTNKAIDTNKGDVSIAKLASNLNRQDPVGFARGSNQSDLYTLARVGEPTALTGKMNIDVGSITSEAQSAQRMLNPMNYPRMLESALFRRSPELFTNFGGGAMAAPAVASGGLETINQ